MDHIGKSILMVKRFVAQYQYANIPTPSLEDFGINATPQSSPSIETTGNPAV